MIASALVVARQTLIPIHFGIDSCYRGLRWCGDDLFRNVL